MSGIPYQGSKRKYAKMILDKILKEHPNTQFFYDLFGGGGAVSFEARRRGLIVFYNELQSDIVALLQKIITDGVTEEFYNWVSKDEFDKVVRFHGECHLWKKGLFRTVWSFGNSGSTYLYGEYITQYKKDYHDMVVNCIDKTFEIGAFWRSYLKDKYKIEADVHCEYPDGKTAHERKLNIRKQLNVIIKNINGIKKTTHLEHLEHLEQLQHLQHLEHLEQLQHLEHLERLNISCSSYDSVNITTSIDKTIVYCDPPYSSSSKRKDTYTYVFDYKKFTDWVCETGQVYPVYVSEYAFDTNLADEVLSLKAVKIISSASRERTFEKLYKIKPYNK